MKTSSKLKLFYLKNRFLTLPIDRMYFHSEEEYIWVSNPKCASTSLLRNFMPPTLENKVPASRISIFNDHGLFRFPVSEIMQKLKDHPTFCVVRNPYHRMISAYKNKIERNQRNTKYWRKKEKRQILETLHLPPRHLNTNVSFSSFVKAVMEIPKKRLDPHFAPQSQILRIPDFKYSETMHLESIHSDLQGFCKKYEVIIQLPKKIYKKNIIDTTKLEITEKQLLQIQKLYSEDFKNLGYDKHMLPHSIDVN
jgi:hypothetical protein